MANKNLVKLGGAYVEITADNGKLISALKDSESRIQSFSSVFAKTGAAFSAIGVGITAPMKKAVEEFADFERQMLITQNVTKASGYQFEKLTRQAKELGATTSWTTSEVAKGMLSLGRMGFSTSEIEKTIKSVMDLGRALDVDVSTASKELGAVMRQFGADSSKAGHYADALATATNSAAIEMSELLESMKYVGAAGAAIGADVETVLALTMALRNSGISASQAGTQLRSMFLKFQNPKDVALFADKFGVSIYNAEGRLKSFLDIIVEAQERARTMGDSLAVTARHMFGTLQAPAFITLLKSKDLEKYRDALYDCDGAAEDFRKAMESGVFGSLKLAESAVEAVGLQLGETLAPSVQETREFIQDLSEIIRTFIQQNAPLVNGIAKTGVAFTALGGVVLAGTGIIKGSVGVTNLLFGAFARLHEAWRKAGADAGVVKNEVQTLNAELEALAMTAATVDLSEPFVSVRNAALEAAASIDDLNAAYGRTTTVNPPTSKRPFHKINVDDLDVSNVPLSVGGKRGETYEMGTGQTEDTVSSSGADIVADQQTKAAEAYNSAVENAAHTKEVNTAVANANAEFAKDDVEDARKKAEGDLVQRESDLMYHSYFADQRTERNAEQQKNEEINEAVENLAQVQAEETQRQLDLSQNVIPSQREEVKKNADAARRKTNDNAANSSSGWDSWYDAQEAEINREEAEEEAAWKAEDKAEKEARKKADRDKRAKRSATKNRRRTNLAKKQKKRRDDAEAKRAKEQAEEQARAREEEQAQAREQAEAAKDYTAEQQRADVTKAKEIFDAETADAKANLEKRDKENKNESSAWNAKYSRGKGHGGRGGRLQAAVAKYNEATAEERANLKRYLEEEGIEGAGEGLANAEKKFNSELKERLKETYDDNEANYIKQVMTAIEEGRDQSYIDNIPTETYNESVQSQAHMLNGRADKQGVASDLESFKTIAPDEAKNLQARARTLVDEKQKRLAWIKDAAEREKAAIDDFNAKVADAQSELDEVIKAELGDGTAELEESYQKKLAAFDKANENLANAENRLKDETKPQHVKNQEAENKAKAGDLAKESDTLSAAAVKEQETLKKLQDELQTKNKQVAGEIIAEQESLKTEGRVLKRRHDNGEIGDDLYKEEKARIKNKTTELDKELKHIENGTSERPELVEARARVAEQQKKVNDSATEAVDTAEKAEKKANKKSSEQARNERTRDQKKEKAENSKAVMEAAKKELDQARSPEGQAEIRAKQREQLLNTADKIAAEAHPDGTESYAESERVIAEAESKRDAAIADSNAKREKTVQEQNKRREEKNKKPAKKTKKIKRAPQQDELREQERRENASLAETEKNEVIEQREEDKEEKKQRDASDKEKKKSRGQKRQARTARRNDLKKIRTQKQNEIAQNTKEALEAIDAQEKASLDAIDSQLEASRKVVADATEETKKTVAAAEKKADAAVAAGKKETAANLKKGKAEINNERKALDATTKQALKNVEANRKADIKLAENLEKVQKSIATDTLASRTEELKLLGASASVASDFKATGYTFGGGKGNISIGGNVSSGPSIRELDVSQMIPARDYIQGNVTPPQMLPPTQTMTPEQLEKFRELSKNAFTKQRDYREASEGIGKQLGEIRKRNRKLLEDYLPKDGQKKLNAARAVLSERNRAAGDSIKKQLGTLGKDYDMFIEMWKNGEIKDNELKIELNTIKKQRDELYRELQAIANGTSNRPELVEARGNVAKQEEAVAAQKKRAGKGRKAREASWQEQRELISALRTLKQQATDATSEMLAFENAIYDGASVNSNYGQTLLTVNDPLRTVATSASEASAATHTYNAAAGQTAQVVTATAEAVQSAADKTYEFTTDVREATVNGQQFSAEMNNAGTMAQAAGDNVAGVGRKSKVAAVGMQALRMAANATVGALKALGGMAVSMLAWTAVMTIFEKIAEYAHKTAEEMSKAREANAEMQGRDQENADNALSSFSTDEEKIDALVESAGSDKVLNNVEQQQLDSLYNDLNSRGIVNGLVVRDPTSNSGYRVLHAGAAAGMKANAARSEYFKLQDKKTGEAYDVSQFAPWAFELGTEVDAEDAKSVIKTTWASKAAKALEHMTPEQRKEFFGTPHAAGGRWNPFYYGTGLGERTAARWEQGEINGWEGEKNQQRKINAIIKEVDDKLAAAGAKGFVNAEDRDALRTYWLGMQGIDANTNWWLEDFQGKQLPGKDIVAAIDAFTADQGAGFIEAVKTIENAGATDKALGDLQNAYNANVADFKAQMNTPYMSEKDKQQAEADAQNAAFDRRGAFETINQTLGANQQKIDEENFTATEKQIAELDRQWQEFMEKAGVSITEEGEVVGDLLDDEWTAFNTAWDSYRAQRAAMDKTAEQERKEKREKEENARSQETTEKLSGLFANYIQAVRSGNANNIQQAAAILNQERAAAKTNGVDLSQYYKDTVGEIKELLNETKTTLSTRSTFSAFEFLDMAQDVVIDVQRQQLEQMRNLNFNAREIYRWMTTQDEYKDYL